VSDSVSDSHQDTPLLEGGSYVPKIAEAQHNSRTLRSLLFLFVSMVVVYILFCHNDDDHDERVQLSPQHKRLGTQLSNEEND